MDIEEKINVHISSVAAFADLLPAVTIIHKIADGSVVWMNKQGLTKLNIKLEDLIKLGNKSYYDEYFNKEDAEDYIPKILGLLESNNDDECTTYFQQVKVDGQTQWTWHMSSTKIFMRDDAGQPILLLTLSLPIESMHTMSLKAEKILAENNFLRENIKVFSTLSKRETEMLKSLAEGESAIECGEKLFISPKTVETHRKNIRKKLGTSSFAELSKYARAFDLIVLFFVSGITTLLSSSESLLSQLA
ncbi:MAG TPA: helix-turn-helix transcriptional regulator [Pelobium sp.]|nr:helix-turn-helix transcriptional regulator [Pelobium sp.]